MAKGYNSVINGFFAALVLSLHALQIVSESTRLHSRRSIPLKQPQRTNNLGLLWLLLLMHLAEVVVGPQIDNQVH